MTHTGVFIGALVALGIVLARAAGTRGVRADRAARLRLALADNARRATRSTPLRRAWSQPPDWFVEAVAVLPGALVAERAWRRYRNALAAWVLVGGWFAGPLLALLASAAIVGAPRVLLGVVRGRHAAAYDASLAVALDAIARSVRGGGSLQAAIGEAAPAVRGAVSLDLQRIATTTQRGVRLDAALAAWRTARDRASVRLAVGAIALAANTGGPPARVIEDVAASLRARLQIEGEARALGSQARLSAVVVGVAPIGFALVACAVDSRNAQLMFGTPIGLACLLVGLTLDVLGAVWMNRISQTVLA